MSSRRKHCFMIFFLQAYGELREALRRRWSGMCRRSSGAKKQASVVLGFTQTSTQMPLTEHWLQLPWGSVCPWSLTYLELVLSPVFLSSNFTWNSSWISISPIPLLDDRFFYHAEKIIARKPTLSILMITPRGCFKKGHGKWNDTFILVQKYLGTHAHRLSSRRL